MSSVDVDGVLRRDYVLVDDTRAVEFERVTEGAIIFSYLVNAHLAHTLLLQKLKQRAENLQYPATELHQSQMPLPAVLHKHSPDGQSQPLQTLHSLTSLRGLAAVAAPYNIHRNPPPIPSLPQILKHHLPHHLPRLHHQRHRSQQRIDEEAMPRPRNATTLSHPHRKWPTARRSQRPCSSSRLPVHSPVP